MLIREKVLQQNAIGHGRGDGRNRRAAASRARIATAMLNLCREGVIEPTAEIVAMRAGVGRRTVFRHFSDMESLYRDMHQTMVSTIEHIIAVPLEGTNSSARLHSFITRRTCLFEEILPIKSAADAFRHKSIFLAQAHASTTRLLREALLSFVGADAGLATTTIEALDLVLSFEAWRRLRLEQGLCPNEAKSIMTLLTQSLLPLAV